MDGVGGGLGLGGGGSGNLPAFRVHNEQVDNKLNKTKQLEHIGLGNRTQKTYIDPKIVDDLSGNV